MRPGAGRHACVFAGMSSRPRMENRFHTARPGHDMFFTTERHNKESMI